MLKKASQSDFLSSLRITERGNVTVKKAKKIVTATVSKELTAKVKTASTLTIKEAKMLRQAGMFKVAERDLYQNMETGDFWKISEDKKGLVRMFKEQDGIADKVAKKTVKTVVKKAQAEDELQIEDKGHAKKVLDAIDKSEDVPDAHIDEHKERLEKGEKPKEVMKDFFKDLPEAKKTDASKKAANDVEEKIKRFEELSKQVRAIPGIKKPTTMGISNFRKWVEIVQEQGEIAKLINATDEWKKYVSQYTSK